MIRIYNQIRKNPALTLFIIGISLRFYSCGYKIFPYNESQTPFIRDISFGFLGLSLLLAIFQNELWNLRNKYRLWLISAAGLLLGLLLYGLYKENDVSCIRYDMASLTFFSALLVGCDKQNWKAIDKMLCIHFLIGIIVMIYAFVRFPPSADRTMIVYPYPPYVLQVLLYPWPYFLVTFYKGSLYRKLLALAGSVVVFISYVFFQKRASTAEFFFLAAFAVLLYLINGGLNIRNFVKRTVNLTFFMVVFFVFLFVEIQIVDPGNIFLKSIVGLMNRVRVIKSIELPIKASSPMNNKDKNSLEHPYDKFSKADRIVESKLFLEAATPLELIIGRGIGGKFYAITEGPTTIHIGLISLILKGGILLLVIWVCGWLMVAADFLFIKKDADFIFCYPIIIKYLIFLSLISQWSSTMEFPLVLLCTGACMSKWIKATNEKQKN
jgi:hypothetical protein